MQRLYSLFLILPLTCSLKLEARELNFDEPYLYAEILLDLGLEASTKSLARRFADERGRERLPSQEIDNKFSLWLHGGKHYPYTRAREAWYDRLSDGIKGIFLVGTIVAPLTKPQGHRLGAFMTMRHTMRFWYLMSKTLKLTVERERPKYHYTKDPKAFDTESFPSGHTGSTFAAACITTMVLDLPTWGNIAVYSLASTVGFLRIAADKHFFTDVAAGAGIGFVAAWTSYSIFEKGKEPEASGLSFQAGANHLALIYRF